MPVIRVSDTTVRRLKAWAEPLEDTVDSALSKALDAAEAKHEADRQREGLDPVEGTPPDSFVEHLLAIPDVGDDADFERDSLPPRDIEL